MADDVIDIAAQAGLAKRWLAGENVGVHHTHLAKPIAQALVSLYERLQTEGERPSETAIKLFAELESAKLEVEEYKQHVREAYEERDVYRAMIVDLTASATPNARFIALALAREAVPALLAEVERLRNLSSCRLCLSGLCSAHQPLTGRIAAVERERDEALARAEFLESFRDQLHASILERDALRAQLAEATAERDGHARRAGFYKSCTLSGEVPSSETVAEMDRL